jgi:hypothetical protein
MGMTTTDAPYETHTSDRLLVLPEVLNVHDLARALAMTPHTVRGLLRRGALPGRRIGKAWLVVREDLLDAIHAPALLCADCRVPVGFATRGDGSELRTCGACGARIAGAKRGRAA